MVPGKVVPMILTVVLSCCMWTAPAAVDATVTAQPTPAASALEQPATPSSAGPSSATASHARFLASTAVKLWGALAASALALAALLAGSTVAMLATAGGLHLGYSGPTLGTDVLLGLAALGAVGAGVALAVGLGASVVGGLWWVADLLTDW